MRLKSNGVKSSYDTPTRRLSVRIQVERDEFHDEPLSESALTSENSLWLLDIISGEPCSFSDGTNGANFVWSSASDSKWWHSSITLGRTSSDAHRFSAYLARFCREKDW
ncbi:hypothetical protein PanWU01x14_370330 [Parasponia andersonii]|uniref:Uncharacterized protein n=1 Tax=Parasponia andersonii TaxID=3476 RepID=A0A2P5A4D2_PARAD|nr:hypothetical protein PanWU01x14_370330 [Parasponia andersonii]